MKVDDGSQQRDQRDLPHEGALAAHVGAGDHQQSALGIEPAIVGLEGDALGFGKPGFHHGVATGLDVDAGVGNELGRAPIQALRALGQCGQRVQAGQGAGQHGKRRHLGAQAVEQTLEEELFSGQSPF
jgi:hypothetical protein